MPPWPARPSQMSKPAPFTARARATSSMVLVAMASMPPASASARASTSRQPPAAAAVRPLPIVDPAERVDLGEEVHERGHQQAFPAAGRGKTGHERHDAAGVVGGGPDQLAQRGGGMGDVGVGEQEPFGPGRRPHGGLRRPAPWPRACPPTPAAGAGRRRPGGRVSGAGAASASARAMSAVPSVLMSSTSTTTAGPGVVLGQQRGQGDGEQVGLVAGRDHDGHGRPAALGARGQPRAGRACHRPRRSAGTGRQAGSTSTRSGPVRPGGMPRRRRVARRQPRSRPGRAGAGDRLGRASASWGHGARGLSPGETKQAGALLDCERSGKTYLGGHPSRRLLVVP